MVGRKERSLKKPDQGMWVWSEHWEATEGSSKEHQTWPGPYFPRGNLTAQLTKPHSQHKIPIHIAMVPYPHVALPSTLGNREPHGESLACDLVVTVLPGLPHVPERGQGGNELSLGKAMEDRPRQLTQPVPAASSEA